MRHDSEHAVTNDNVIPLQSNLTYVGFHNSIFAFTNFHKHLYPALCINFEMLLLLLSLLLPFLLVLLVLLFI